MFYEIKKDDVVTQMINLDNVESFVFFEGDKQVQVFFVDSDSSSIFITLEEYERLKKALLENNQLYRSLDNQENKEEGEKYFVYIIETDFPLILCEHEKEIVVTNYKHTDGGQFPHKCIFKEEDKRLKEKDLEIFKKVEVTKDGYVVE